jgi:FixJ family two-component response regulator
LDADAFDDPKKFLDFVRDHVVRVAVLDMTMPVRSGIEVKEELSRLSPETKVIFISGQEERAAQAVAVGAFAFFAKPLVDKVFLASVRSAIG